VTILINNRYRGLSEKKERGKKKKEKERGTTV